MIVGHARGGGIARICAAEYPQATEKLIVLNCLHPVAFQHHLKTNWRQL
ncbi:MAG TPA: hypothetical protein PKJ85_13510 [Nitrosomonas nitrosa]|nr:hypothetical protein [Nitrosomonas nitrosa]